MMNTTQTKLTAMDVYSVDMTIPFDIAAYCRQHKLSPEAVNLARAIKKREAAKEALKIAEELVEGTDKLVEARIQIVRKKMEGK